MDDRSSLHEPWRSCINRGQHLYEAGKLDDALELLKVCEKDILFHLFKTLDIQALVHTKKDDYAKAHECAQAMIRMAPWEPSGYLRRTEIYLARKMYYDAHRLLEIDLKNIPGDWKCYPELVRCAKQICALQKDFVGDLPLDLVQEVFKWVGVPQILTVCMTVSKTWRIRLQHCGPLWAEIDMNDLNRNNIKLYQLRKMMPYIRKVRINAGMIVNMSELTSFWYYVDIGIINRIQEFTWVEGRTMFGPSWMGFLSLSSRTLTHFRFEASESPFTLPFIIRTFPRLEELHYSNSTIFGNSKNTAVRLAPRLRHLGIAIHSAIHSWPMKLITAAQLEALLPSLPNLSNLSIEECETPSLSLLDKYCPHIEQASFTSMLKYDTRSPPSQWQKHRLTGLRILRVEPRDLDDLVKFLQRHSGTLEELSINLCRIPEQVNIPQALSYIRCNRLRRLEFLGKRGFQTAVDILSSILQWKPSLETLKLDTMPYISPEIFRLVALHSYKSLRYLSIKDVMFLEGLDDLLVALGEQGKACTLREVYFEDCNLTDSHLLALGSIPTLERISLTADNEKFRYHPYSLVKFFKNQVKHQHLIDITLIDANASVNALRAIKQIKTVKTLSIDLQDDLRKYDIVKFKTANPQISVDHGFSDDEYESDISDDESI